jgi:branched-chain amino acid transport system permease protein
MDVPIQLILAQVVNGIIVGAMYALFAGGLTLIWGTMKMLNFAHGEFFMLGGFLVFFTYAVLGLHPIAATLIAVAVIFAVGVAVERVVIHPLLSRPVWQLTTIIATLGLSIILQNAALNIWGPAFKNVPYFVEGVLDLGGIRIAYQRVLIFCVSVVSMAALWFILKYSRFGLALRATAEDSDAAQLYGVNIHRIFTLTFGLSAALAALAAVMLAPIMAVYPAMGLSPLLKGFVVVILGGLGNFAGAIVGGALLGIVESLSVIHLDSEWSDVVAFVFLVLVIWVRPWGLFGVEERS